MSVHIIDQVIVCYQTWYLIHPRESYAIIPKPESQRQNQCDSSTILPWNEGEVAGTTVIPVRVEQGDCMLNPRFWWHATIYHSPTQEQKASVPTDLSIGISSQVRIKVMED